MENKNINYSSLPPETIKLLTKIEANSPVNQQLQQIRDIATMVQEIITLIDDGKATSTKTVSDLGALLMDIRETLSSLDKKELPESPDYAKPVVEAVSKLEKALTNALNSVDVKPVFKPNISVDAPQVSVNAPEVDLTGVEKVIKNDLTKAFKEAIKLIPKTEIPETDFQPLLDVWQGISEQLLSIETATRMKPQPGNMKSSQLGVWNVGTTTVNEPKVGQTTSNSTPQRLNAGASISVTNGILVQAIAANTNNIYIGGGLVTSTSGYELQPGQAVPFTVNDVNELYVIGGSGSDKCCWNVC